MQSVVNTWGWSTILEDPSYEEEQEEETSVALPGAPRPKKELKEMTNKELIAHCNSLVKKVARNQIAIEALRKKKGVPNTASLGECKQCKVLEGRYTDVIYENRMKDEKHEDEIENLEDQIEGLKKDIAKLQNEKTKLENEALIEVVRLKALNDQLVKAEALSLFYQSQLFQVKTPSNAAQHTASVSMAGGGGNRGLSPAVFFASPTE